jgi:hypothetical protein
MLRMSGLLPLLSLLNILLAPVMAWAHGGVGIEQDSCVERTGSSLIHFAAYQPEVSPTEEFCTSLSQVGNTILVFDLIDEALRKRPAAIRVVQTGNADEPRTVLDVPAQTYLNGVVNTEITFEAPGQYAAIVTLENPHDQITFPFSVGPWSVQLLVAVGCLILGAVGSYFFFVGKKKPAELKLVKG